MQTLIDHARSPGEHTAAHDEHRARCGRPAAGPSQRDVRDPRERLRAHTRAAAGHLGPHGRLHAVDTGRALAHHPASADPLLPL
ncbi:hypothetical protein [Streptomyces albidochromogenes]|uniref:Uncharacterized protein n=1 Tax=Streptomyces albidochromogenes TaxID=329524 RepID=A0ABW6FMU3_9ACTN